MPSVALYSPPVVSVVQEGQEFVENDLPVFIAAIGWVMLVFGSAWAFCQASCGWGNVQECTTSWLNVKAVCQS